MRALAVVIMATGIAWAALILIGTWETIKFERQQKRDDRAFLQSLSDKVGGDEQ